MLITAYHFYLYSACQGDHCVGDWAAIYSELRPFYSI